MLVGVIVARSDFKVKVPHAARRLTGNGSLLLCWLVGLLYTLVLYLYKNNALAILRFHDLFGMVSSRDPFKGFWWPPTRGKKNTLWGPWHQSAPGIVAALSKSIDFGKPFRKATKTRKTTRYFFFVLSSVGGVTSVRYHVSNFICYLDWLYHQNGTKKSLNSTWHVWNQKHILWICTGKIV